MAHLWYRDADDVWRVRPLGECALDISVCPPRDLVPEFRLGHDTLAAVVSAPAGGAARWVLLVAGDTEIRVGGFPTVAGVRVLQDRDEIGVHPSGTLFYSAETLARVEEFAAGERAIFCPRCRQPVESGQLAVRCPHCGIWHHQTAGLPCWTYSPTCGVCPQATALDRGYEWVPEA
jgi:hypothetical protein